MVFKDKSGIAQSIKGHIVATRYATENDTDRVKSTIFAEDPKSPGRVPIDIDFSSELARDVLATHYSNVVRKLRQPVLASSLASGVRMPDELRVNGIAWRVDLGPLPIINFIGGYFGIDGPNPRAYEVDGRVVFDRPDPLRLNAPGFTFFGVEESILRRVTGLARGEVARNTETTPFEPTDFFYSGFSVLRDGTALAPLEFFEPVEQVTF